MYLRRSPELARGSTAFDVLKKELLLMVSLGKIVDLEDVRMG